MFKTRFKSVLITGAGSGIGKAITEILLRKGSRVLAVSLLEQELDQLARDCSNYAESLTCLVLDLSQTDSSQKLWDYCREKKFVPDTLINNAGYACFGELTEQDPEVVANLIALNVITLTQLCLLFGKQMVQQGGGRILNVGSTAGMLPAARFSIYGASKSFVNSLSLSLRAELAPHGVVVSCLAPGPVSTGFAARAKIGVYQERSLLKWIFDRGLASTPQMVAAQAIRGLEDGKSLILAGRGARLFYLISRLLPQTVIAKVLKL